MNRARCPCVRPTVTTGLTLRSECAGWITKKKSTTGGWKQRYMNLRGETLSYYESNLMKESTKLGEISMSGCRVLPCTFSGEKPTFAGMSLATGMVLAPAGVGHMYYLTDPVAAKKNKQAAKVKKKEEKAAEKAAKKAAKKGGGGAEEDGAEEDTGPTELRLGQGGGLAAAKAASLASATAGATAAGASAAQAAKDKKDATIQEWINAMSNAGW